MQEIATSLKRPNSIFDGQEELDEMRLGTEREMDILSEISRNQKKNKYRRSVEPCQTRISKVSKRREIHSRFEQNQLQIASTGRKKRLILNLGVENLSQKKSIEFGMKNKAKFSKIFEEFEMKQKMGMSHSKKYRTPAALKYRSQKSLPREGEKIKKNRRNIRGPNFKSEANIGYNDENNHQTMDIGKNSRIKTITRRNNFDSDFQNLISPPTSSLRKYMTTRDINNQFEDIKTEKNSPKKNERKRKSEKSKKNKKVTGKFYTMKYAFNNKNNSNRVKYQTHMDTLTEKNDHNRKKLQSRINHFRKKFEVKKTGNYNMNRKMVSTLTSKVSQKRKQRLKNMYSRKKIENEKSREEINENTYCNENLKEKSPNKKRPKKDVMDYIKEVSLRQSNYTNYSKKSVNDKINYLKGKLSQKDRGKGDKVGKRRVNKLGKKEKFFEKGDIYGYLFGDKGGREKVLNCFLTNKR